MEEEVIIFADEKGKNNRFVRGVYDYILKKEDRTFPITLSKVNITEFRDKEIKYQIGCNVRKKRCVFIHDSNKSPDRWFTELCFVNESLKYSDAKETIDVLPYVRYARQDRKDKSRVALNSRVVADMISLYANRVMCADIHALQIQGFYRIPFDSLFSGNSFLEDLILKEKGFLSNCAIISPDAGGATRAEKFSSILKSKGINSNLVIGVKIRKKEGEVGTLQLLGDVENKNALILDDIVDSGGTLIKTVEKLKEMGSKKIYGYATHGLFTEGVEKVVSCFDKFFISDTFYQEENEKLNVFSLAPLFGEAIYRSLVGESLSDLFN